MMGIFAVLNPVDEAAAPRDLNRQRMVASATGAKLTSVVDTWNGGADSAEYADPVRATRGGRLHPPPPTLPHLGADSGGTRRSA